MDRLFKKNLDKLVENTIRAEELKHKEKQFTNQRKQKGFFDMLFKGAKWQVAFLTSFIGVLFLGTIAFAAVPALREAVIPTKGTLYVNSKPEGATVELKGGEYIEYTKLGETPFEEKIKAGKYEMRLSLEDYERYETDIEMLVGERTSFDITLKEIMTALDSIKEWKTYVDLENGYEFTYPLNWDMKTNPEEFELQDSTISGYEFNNGEFIGVKASGEDALLRVYNYTSEFDVYCVPEKEEIDGKEYNLAKDYDEWSYIIFEEFKSGDETNSVKLAFFTNDTNKFEIYDFIASSVQVYDSKEDGVDSWMTYSNTNFSLKYPSEGWIIVEESKTEYYSQYNIRPIVSETDPLEIFYSYGYLEQLNNYSYDRDEYINGHKVHKYLSGLCDGEYLYEFPSRIYVHYKTPEDLDTNSIYEKILGTIDITSEGEFYTVSDYDRMFSINIPHDWQYVEASDTNEFEVERFVKLYGDIYNLSIFKWEDIDNSWDGLMSQANQQMSKYETRKIKIDGREYTRIAVWEGDSEDSLLKFIFFIKDDFDGDFETIDPKISLSENDFVVLFAGGNITNYENITEIEDEQLISNIDAIVASMKGL